MAKPGTYIENYENNIILNNCSWAMNKIRIIETQLILGE